MAGPSKRIADQTKLREVAPGSSRPVVTAVCSAVNQHSVNAAAEIVLLVGRPSSQQLDTINSAQAWHKGRRCTCREDPRVPRTNGRGFQNLWQGKEVLAD